MSEPAANHEERKERQLVACMNHDVQPRGMTTAFEHFRLRHQALPEIAWEDVDLRTSLLGKPLRAPLIIAPMTGGCALGSEINRNLALAAQRLGLGMGVGSQRAAIDDEKLSGSFRVRDLAPDILLLANLGAVQLNAGYGVEECRRAVDMIGADGLCLHLNALQEAHQFAGDRDFCGLAAKIEAVCRGLGAPVVVKEVGWGIGRETARRLIAAGVSAIDVSGAGGTSWWIVEQLVNGHTVDEANCSPFARWGIPTARALRETLAVAKGTPVIASGGIRDGVEVAKALALGATLVAIGQPLLRPAAESASAVVVKLEQIILELRTAMFCAGIVDVALLRGTPSLESLS